MGYQDTSRQRTSTAHGGSIAKSSVGSASAKLASIFLAALSLMIPAHADQSFAQHLTKHDLLAVAFPSWPGGRASSGASIDHIASIDLPKIDWPWLESRHYTSERATIVQINPMRVIRLDAKRAVLLTWALPIGDGVSAACHYGCTYAIGAYFYSLGPEGWALSRRIDVVDTVFADSINKVGVEAWPGHGVLVSAIADRFAQGKGVWDLWLMGIESQSTYFNFSTSMGENDLGFLDDCDKILSPNFRPRPGTDYSSECSRADGTWRIDGDSIRIDINGLTREMAEGGHWLPLKRLSWHAKLQPKNGKLELESGSLPGFGI